MFCNNCGVELKDGMTFCPNCGAQTAGEMPAGDDGKTSALRDGDVQEQQEADPPVEEKAEADPEEHGESIEEATEKIEAVEISPTGVIGQGTAVAVPAENEQKKFCPNCGTQNGINDLFCQECGMFFGNEDKKMGAENGKVRPAGKTLK
ncbi:MAG: zinc-ribbon domain-containing protein, partial [Lachnospiraceae bacterium]|nr:zinc-ribbon domain-containing protein [Lachnospiraceae bacterium]